MVFDTKEYYKQYYLKNKEVIKKRASIYGKERYQNYGKERYKNEKKEILKQQKERYRNDPEYRRKCLENAKKQRQNPLYHKQYYLKNKERILQKQKERLLKKDNNPWAFIPFNKLEGRRGRKSLPPEERRKRRNLRKKLYYKKHPEKHKEQKRKYRANRRKKGYIELWKSPFPEEIQVEYHHIRYGLPFVIPLPKITHQFKLGILKEHISWNDEWIKKIYGVEVSFLVNY